MTWHVVTSEQEDGRWASVWTHDTGRIVVRYGADATEARAAAEEAAKQPPPPPIEETVDDADLGA